MDADPPNWEKSCKAARKLQQDLVDGCIDVRTYKPKTVHTMRNPLFTQYPLHRFTNNLRNIMSNYQVAKLLGEEALQIWVIDGKMPSSSGKCIQ